MEFVLLTCFVVSAISSVVAVVGAGYALLRTDLPANVRAALGTAILAVVPGVLFLLQSALVGLSDASRTHLPAHELITFWPAIMWALVGPFIFLRSLTLAKVRQVPQIVDVARLLLALGWASLSFIAVLSALLF